MVTSAEDDGLTTSTGEVVTGLFLFCFHKSSTDMPNSEAVAEVVVVVVDATELVLDMLETFERTPLSLEASVSTLGIGVRSETTLGLGARWVRLKSTRVTISRG